MRHGKKFNHLGRRSPHRKALMANLASSLIIHKRIKTTVAKAKALRKFVEPILTRSKSDTTHSRRMVFRYVRNKDVVTELFGEVAEKIAKRPGGYTRILRTGVRFGDNAEMCVIELVDYNENLLKGTDTQTEETSKKKRTRRSRRGKEKSAPASASAKATADKTADKKATASLAEADTRRQAGEGKEGAPEAKVDKKTTAAGKPASAKAAKGEEKKAPKDEKPASDKASSSAKAPASAKATADKTAGEEEVPKDEKKEGDGGKDEKDTPDKK